MTKFQKSPYLWQALLAWTLFIASIGALFFNSITAYWLPSRELAAREQVREASVKLAEETRANLDRLPTSLSKLNDEDNSLLTAITERVLRDYPGVEGGFYIGGDSDVFAGFAFPSEKADHPRRASRRDPPPRELPHIRIQAQQSMQSEDSHPLIQSRDVGPSRIVIATVPVSTAEPPFLVVWLMYRVTGPEEQRSTAVRFQISTVLALGGLISALLMTLHLRRRLNNEQASREQLREELRKSEHLASLGLMLAQVAHEVRNPLAGIRSTAQLWQRLPEMTRSPESLQALVNAVDRLDELLTRLLNFSKSDRSEQIRVNLNRVIEETIALTRAHAVQHAVQLHISLDPKLPDVLGVESSLRQVVLNLTMNALQAMPEGGHLTFRTRADGIERNTQLDIEDDGPGINPELQARLFEPFFTTRTHGTGLGLALSREIVLQHGGRIELLPAKPHGTLCRLSFPTAPQATM